MFGIRVMGILVKLKYPNTTMVAVITIDGSGCRIDHAEMFSAINALPLD
jgi:hypothetical protein